MSKSTGILSKKQNYALWQSGAFGNKLRAWRTIDEWLASGFTGSVSLRTLLRGGNGPCIYDVPSDQVLRAIDHWRIVGVSSNAIMINESAPDDAVVLQGEYLNAIGALHESVSQWGYFLHSRAQYKMRDALRLAPVISQGLLSDLLIREVMTPSSYDDWQILLERYPDHVFEVSIYDRCLGDIPNRNALVWEIRKY